MSSLAFDEQSFTPYEARATALAVARWLGTEKFSVQLEAGLDGAPYRTTILAKSNGLEFLVEAQNAPAWTTGLGELTTWLSLERKYAQLYLAIEPSDDIAVTGRMLEEMKRSGCGLLLVSDTGVDVYLEARNPALIVTPDPTLQFGHARKSVQDAVGLFNRGERIAGLRDMCELVEGETAALARKAARRGWLDRTEPVVEQMDFSNKINVLASQDRYTGGRDPLVSERLKLDLHSFRGARNLVDHPPASKRAGIKREKQFPERMMMGPRLIAELVPLRRKVR